MLCRCRLRGAEPIRCGEPSFTLVRWKGQSHASSGHYRKFKLTHDQDSSSFTLKRLAIAGHKNRYAKQSPNISR